jgi:hypothetical protein
MNSMEHKHATLLRMAADNADQLFECDKWKDREIDWVTNYPDGNWRPVKTTKKIKRWLWADKEGMVTTWMYSNEEALEQKSYPVKLLWSETEFEVEE